MDFAISEGERILPNCLEVLYINRNYYEFGEIKDRFPLEIDRRNDKQASELILGEW